MPSWWRRGRAPRRCARPGAAAAWRRSPCASRCVGAAVGRGRPPLAPACTRQQAHTSAACLPQTTAAIIIPATLHTLPPAARAQDRFAPLLQQCSQLIAAGENTDRRVSEILGEADGFVDQVGGCGRGPLGRLALSGANWGPLGRGGAGSGRRGREASAACSERKGRRLASPRPAGAIQPSAVGASHRPSSPPLPSPSLPPAGSHLRPCVALLPARLPHLRGGAPWLAPGCPGCPG